MSGQNIAGHLNAVYQNIIAGVTETLNNSVTSRKLFTEYKWNGSHIEHVLHTRRSGAVKFGSDGDSFPTAKNQTHAKFKVGRKCLLASVKLTDGVMAAAAKAPEVAVDAMTSETEGIMTDIGVLDSFFSFRDGTGAVATVMVSYAGGTPTLIEVDDARLVWPGCEYDLYTSAGVYRSTVTVSSVDTIPDATQYMQVTVAAGDANMVATDKLYWKDSYGLAYTGLDALIDDSVSSTFQGVTMSGQKQWVSLVFDNNGTKRDISPEIFRNFLAGLKQHSDESADSMREFVAIGSPFMLSELDAMYESAYRLAPDTKVLGIAAPAFQCSAGKIALKAERHAPYYKMFVCEAGDLRRGYHKKLSWRIENGAILKRSDVNASWSGTLIEFAENFIMKRRGCGKIADLNETISVAD